ncbi:hypothetical protein NDU88_004558 [Pleurodeles waltl]|uniref:Uncharacterized protein n=1 Tax=Pleurodeles waltl TaxID=8319 RepID=A0AAV7NPN4_PLEWA|nr:hypothetical protein NDU88_004558 [Pleurodeles waltl]
MPKCTLVRNRARGEEPQTPRFRDEQGHSNSEALVHSLYPQVASPTPNVRFVVVSAGDNALQESLGHWCKYSVAGSSKRLTARRRNNASTSIGPSPEKESKGLHGGKENEEEGYNITVNVKLSHFTKQVQPPTVGRIGVQKAKTDMQEGQNITNTCLKLALDAADAASRHVFTSITLQTRMAKGFELQTRGASVDRQPACTTIRTSRQQVLATNQQGQ